MTLDLEGLRLTKQSPRGKDRVDLQHIEAALRAIQGRVSERVAAMSRRDFVAETPPSDDSIEFKVEEVSAPSPDAETRPLAKAIVARALARGIALDEAFEDRLSIYGDAATPPRSASKIQTRNHKLWKPRRHVLAPIDPGRISSDAEKTVNGRDSSSDRPN
jgi:hypothetical protein